MIVSELDRNQAAIQNKIIQSQPVIQHSKAELDANSVIKYIVERVHKEVQLKSCLAKNLLKYSNFKAIGNMNEANNLFFQLGFVASGWPKQQDEPKPLSTDSLLPISADIDPQNQYKNKLNTRRLIEQSSQRQRIRGKDSTTDIKQKYRKLQFTEASQEDGFTKELRRIEEDKNQKLQVERKINEKKEKIRLQKLKDKKKEEVFSYDYNGELIEMKLQSKANLVSKLVNGATREDMNIVKQAINDPNPTTVDGVNAGKKAGKKLDLIAGAGVSKRKDDIEFSQLKTLADGFKTTYGIKYTHEGKTLEEKKRVVTTMELKKSLSQRKISKEEYQKLRDLNNNNREQLAQKLKQSTTKQNEIKSQRAQSEIKFGQNVIRKARQTIHISNSGLKEKLLQKVVQLQQPGQAESQYMQTTEGSKFKIGSIDNYNMQYMKGGGSLPTSASRQLNPQKSNSQLPKIMHTTLYSKMKPKGRERLKDANQIFREMRKKFEDKLRV